MIDWQQLLSGGGTAPPATPSTPGNPVGSAIGGTSPFGIAPYMTPEQAVQFAPTFDQLGNYTYSFPAGGYLTNADAQNANSYYNKFGAGGGGDPAANAAVRSIYGALGDLPTTARGSPALNAFNQQHGITPRLGSSLNEMLGTLMASPAGPMVRQAGFGSQYEGPYGFGRRDPNYNMWGSYKG